MPITASLFALLNPIIKSNLTLVRDTYDSFSWIETGYWMKTFGHFQAAILLVDRFHGITSWTLLVTSAGADARKGSCCDVNPLTVRERVFAELMSRERVGPRGADSKVEGDAGWRNSAEGEETWQGQPSRECPTLCLSSVNRDTFSVSRRGCKAIVRRLLELCV